MLHEGSVTNVKGVIFAQCLGKLEAVRLKLKVAPVAAGTLHGKAIDGRRLKGMGHATSVSGLAARHWRLVFPRRAQEPRARGLEAR